MRVNDLGDGDKRMVDEKKLKTLKDIDALVMCMNVDIPRHIKEDDLRDAAREWIKCVEDKRKNYCKDFDIEITEWIKHFFNLDEEE
jgi:hypothetical protein